MGPNDIDKEKPTFEAISQSKDGISIAREQLRITAVLQATRLAKKPTREQVIGAIRQILPRNGVTLHLAPETISYSYNGHDISITQIDNSRDPNDAFSGELNDLITDPYETAFHSCSFAISYCRSTPVDSIRRQSGTDRFIHMQQCGSHEVVNVLFNVLDAIDESAARDPS